MSGMISNVRIVGVDVIKRDYSNGKTNDDRIPKVDVVEVVRCKDCKYNTGDHKCLYPDSIIKVPDDYDYCSYGQRRSVE